MDIFQGNGNLGRLEEMERVDVWWKGDVGFDWFREEILLLQGLQVLDDWAFEIV